MTGLTVAERIIVHLGRFVGHCDEYSAPVDVSQNGISQAVRISRAHAAIELKKLKESGIVTEALAHIKGSRQRRKVYNLTPSGMSRAEQIRNYAESEGIDVSALLDLARCDPAVFWDTLEEDERRAFGTACLLNGPFDPAAIGEECVRLLPVDDQGMAVVPQNMRDAVPSLLAPEVLRECHSKAADHCLSVKDYAGRLHHLANAGRVREAAMLIDGRGESLLHGMDGRLNDAVALLNDVPERHRSKVWDFQARAALSVGDHQRCRELIDRISPVDLFSALVIEGDLLAAEGDAAGALSCLEEAHGMSPSSVSLNCRMADVLCELGRHEESLHLLEKVLRESADDGSCDRTDQILFHIGRTLLRSGRPDDAVKALSKGMTMAPDGDRRPWHLLMGEAYQAAGLQDRASEHFRKAR